MLPGLAAVLAERLFFTPPRARPAREDDLPAGASALPVKVGGRSIAAWRWGRGPTVVLLHGWGGRGAQLAAFVPPLVARGFSVVAFDAPGHGATGGRRSSIPEFARALKAVCEAAGEVRAVVAHSLGAAAAALAVRDGLAPARAVFLAPPSDPAGWTRAFAGRLGIGRDVMRRMRARSERRLRVRWDDLHVPTLLQAFSGDLLVFHDREDGEVPWAQGAAVAAAAAEASLVTTDGLGHRRLLREPSVVERAVSFLATAPRRPAGRSCPACGRPTAHAGSLCNACALEQTLFDPALRAAAAPATQAALATPPSA